MTKKWIRLAVSKIGRNHNQSKAKTHSWWNEVQRIIWNIGQDVERKKIYAAKDFERLEKQLAGVGMSLAAQAVNNPNDIDGVVYYAQGNIENVIRSLARNSPLDFSKKMSRKINEANMAFHDSNLD